MLLKEKGQSNLRHSRWRVCRHTARINTTQNRRPSAHAYHATIALGTVLAMLAGAVVADLACGDGRVVFGGALAAVADRGVDDEPGRPAEERLGAAALELTDAGRGELRRARLDACTVQQIPAIAALQQRSSGGTRESNEGTQAMQNVSRQAVHKQTKHRLQCKK